MTWFEYQITNGDLIGPTTVHEISIEKHRDSKGWKIVIDQPDFVAAVWLLSPIQIIRMWVKR